MKTSTSFALSLLFVVAALRSTEAGRDILQKGGAAPAPAPSAKSLCRLPGDKVIDAPEATTSSQYLYYYYSDYSFSYYSYYYTTYSYSDYYDFYYYYGKRHLLQGDAAPAPAPLADLELCCPTTDVRQGDTVASLQKAAGLPTDADSLFYALNPGTSADKPLEAGTTVTVPCYRFTAYLKEKVGSVPAPAPAKSSA